VAVTVGLSGVLVFNRSEKTVQNTDRILLSLKPPSFLSRANRLKRNWQRFKG
jgi:hypothetical protein